jgi:maltose O-acetyltransferase
MKIKNIIDECHRYFSSFKFYLYNQWITYLPIHFFRVLYLKKVLGITIGDNSFVHMRCFFCEGSVILIGKNTVIGTGAYLSGEITVGNNVSLTAFCHIQSSSHYKDSQIFEGYSKPIIIDDRAWIGVRSYIGPGIRVGEGGILAAQSVLTKDIPPFTVWGGCPAKEISKRSSDINYTLYYFPIFN